jgi:hypothetical protein
MIIISVKGLVSKRIASVSAKIEVEAILVSIKEALAFKSSGAKI